MACAELAVLSIGSTSVSKASNESAACSNNETPKHVAPAVSGQCAPHSTNTGAAAWLIDQGRRLHLQHGPIDLIIECVGADADRLMAYRLATTAFHDVLPTLVSELPALRTGSKKRSAGHGASCVSGPVALRMQAAIIPFADLWLSPMIAVAGAVADHMLAALHPCKGLERIMINNGGDIALQLKQGSECLIGICSDPATGCVTDTVALGAASGIGGVATSGWRGRSHSLGIADAVTVLASDAATADVAATLIANAIDLPGCSAISRMPATDLSPDSDLGDRLVTTHVETLSGKQQRVAMQSGAKVASEFFDQGLIAAAYLHLQGGTRLIGHERLLLQNQLQINTQTHH